MKVIGRQAAGHKIKRTEILDGFSDLNVCSVDACAPTSSHWPCEVQTAEMAEDLGVQVLNDPMVPGHM
jgi:hypothetical protein